MRRETGGTRETHATGRSKLVFLVSLAYLVYDGRD
jgi:hypothetical protein